MRPRHSYGARILANHLLNAASLMSPAEQVTASLAPRDPFLLCSPCDSSPGGSHEVINTQSGPVCVHCWRAW